MSKLHVGLDVSQKTVATNFDTDAKLVRFAAIVQKKDPTGVFESDDTPMTHSRNGYLRYYVVETANSLTIHHGDTT